MSADELTGRDRQLHILTCGEIEIEGRMPWSSNATFLVKLTCGDEIAQGIYKLLRGERPLWDFEPGLHRLKVAAYLLSESLGFDLVPPTVLREGPFGEGSVQWFVDVDHRQHYFTIHEERPDLHDTLRGVALFDLVANNTDRKSGHVLIDGDDHIWGIDHGLCFSADFKLRTVVWEFGGESIDGALIDRIRPLVDRVPLEIATLLADDEVEALQERAEWVIANPTFPVDQSGRRYPWPIVSDLDDLIHRADLDGLVRMVDNVCADRDAALLEVRNRSRAAVTTGRQLWPVATLAEYRLALWAPAEWATQVLDEESGMFTIGPLTEVVAQRHEFADLRAALSDGPRLGFIAHECALRGQHIPADVANPLEIPFELQPWEPDFCLADYSDDGIDAPAPPLPTAADFAAMPVDEPDAVDDPDVTLAVRQLVEPWTTSSNGHAEIAAVEGTAASAVAALGVGDGRLAPISPATAVAWLAWAGSSGGAHGRRRGAAIGRFGAWWTVAALADLTDDWPVEPDEVGEALTSFDWYWWDAGGPSRGWDLQLAVADRAEGYAWAISAHDAV